MNQVAIVGNLTADPELRYTAGGIPVANFTVAVSHREYQDGAHQDRLDGFFGCVAWRTSTEDESGGDDVNGEEIESPSEESEGVLSPMPLAAASPKRARRKAGRYSSPTARTGFL